MTVRVGQWVRCDRAEPAHGTFGAYAGRIGRVAAVHREVLPSGAAYVEIGVDFGARAGRQLRPQAWFRPAELQPCREPARPRLRARVRVS